MSSTPRSRHSSRSLPWRTSPKNQAPTSLSLIVATPQVAAPRASAVAHLPHIIMASDSDARTGLNGVRGALTPQNYPSRYECLKVQSADPKSPVNAETGSTGSSQSDHNGRQCFRFILYIYMRIRSPRAAVDSSAIPTFSSDCVIPDAPQYDRLQPPSTNHAGDPPASDPDPTNSTSQAPGPTSSPATPVPPRSRSWFASLSRRGSSNVPLNELAEQAPPPPTEQPVGAQPASHSITVAAMPSSQLAEERPETVPTNLPISEPPTPTTNASSLETEGKLVPRKRAWFASSSSPKRPSKLRPGDEPSRSVKPAPTDTPVLETPQLPVTNIIPPTPPRLELTQVESKPPSEAAPVPIPFAPKLGTASSSQSRSPDSDVRRVSGPDAGIVSPSAPPSVDDQGRKLPSAASSLESVSPPVMLPTESSQSLSSLIPSASRFSLSIPFLGRPKVPLERAMASAHATDIRTELAVSSVPSEDLVEIEGGESRHEASGEVPSLNLTVSKPSTILASEIASVDCAPPSGPKSEPAIDDGPTAQDSWWGLVGWRPATAPSQLQDPPSIRPSDHESVAIINDVTSKETDTSSVDNLTHLQAQHGSTLLPETPQVRGSSWLASWPWYGQSVSMPVPGITQPEEASANQLEVETTKIPKTAEAEVVKEAPIHQRHASTAHIDPTNPIQSSITANISGWTSFFSSRSLLAKRIADTEHREDDPMEVMVIDEGDDERVVTSETRGGKDLVAREVQVSRQSPAPPRSPSPSPKPKAKPDDLKGTKRTSVSPAPSKSSGRASPRVPPPPNLVLPTWDDTFLMQPRSTVPRAQTDSALAKTVRFVSGMLFTRDDSASTRG
jgi:hypothetical protein